MHQAGEMKTPRTTSPRHPSPLTGQVEAGDWRNGVKNQRVVSRLFRQASRYRSGGDRRVGDYSQL